MNPNLPPVALEVSSLLVSNPSGIAVYGRSLTQALQECLGREQLQLFCRLSRFHKRQRNPVPTTVKPYIDGRFIHRRYPILHALDTRLPSSYRGFLIATLFDVVSALPVAEERHLSPCRFRKKKNRQYLAIARRANVIVTISEETRRRFLETFPVRGEVHVAYPGIHPIFRPEAATPQRLRELGLNEAPYVLFVGELCTRKNLEAVVEVYQRVRGEVPDLELVLVGNPSFGWHTSPARKRILESPRGVRLLGFLSQKDLAAAYAGAAAFLYLSHYEGFGMPVLEAMASGTPVVASNRGGIPEAAGNVAALVDPNRPQEATEALTRILRVKDTEAARRQAGIAWARRFSWQKCREKVVELYQHGLP